MYIKFIKNVNEYPSGTVVEFPKKFGQPYVNAKVALETDRNGRLKKTPEVDNGREAVEDSDSGKPTEE